MRKKQNAILLFLLIISSEIVIGKETNKTKTHKANHKKSNNLKEKANTVRLKRSMDEDEDRPFWANRGKKQVNDYLKTNKYENILDKASKIVKERDEIEKEPFWGTRGRRDSSSSEKHYEDNSGASNDPNCEYCYGTVHKYDQSDNNYKDRRDDRVLPFWGNRGRRNSDEIDSSEPFWGNRGRRQENDPFWGTRGRRSDEFWASRGRRHDEPFWGNRGRRDEVEPFWGNRGRRQESEPFWGNRGRRQESEPFWGTRGRRNDEPSWGNHEERKENEDVFWGSRGRRKEDLKTSIMEAINDVEDDIEHLSRLRRSDQSFWANRERESKLNYLFNGPARNKIRSRYLGRNFDLNLKPAAPGTVHDNRIYAEEPNYIVVERSSRSSGEEDPFFISRGKKYYLNYDLAKAARDRRGAIEEIVKSVKTDPYFIARGKKDDINVTSTLTNEEFVKVKELICSAIDLISASKEKGKVKREIDGDSDRRTILKKLAAQLQNDPYFVSRGKKNDVTSHDDNLEEFIADVAKKCV